MGTAVSIFLDRAQTFELVPNGNIDRFRLWNIPDGSTSFTIKVRQQGSSQGTPQGVGINTFNIGAGDTCMVQWPGGVVPVVTGINSATDIYSFKIFDGVNLRSAPGHNSIFGVIGGQNYS